MEKMRDSMVTIGRMTLIAVYLILSSSKVSVEVSAQGVPSDSEYVDAVLRLTETNKSRITGRRDWCGESGTTLAEAIPDEWFSPNIRGKSAKFYEGCKRHDACYGTLGRTRSWCDQTVKGRLIEECERAYNTIVDRAAGAQGSCRAVAIGYYEALVASNDAAATYRKSQATARDTHPLRFGHAYSKEAWLAAKGMREGIFGHVNWAQGQDKGVVKGEIRNNINTLESALNAANDDQIRKAFAYLENAWLIFVHQKTEPFEGHYN